MTRWRWWWAVLAFFAIPIALYAFSFLYFRERMFPPQLKESFLARPWGVYPHAVIGGIALLIGPLQFNRRFMVRRRRAHRVMGRIYVIGALLTGVVGTYMAWYAFGGPLTQLGFALLGLSLLFTTTKAFTSIKGGDVPAHRRWMIRSFALLFAAVTLRIELPILGAIFGAFEPAYRIVAWSCWVPNLLVAEAIVQGSADVADVTVERPVAEHRSGSLSNA